jgi:parvulin-like peptidyl-prolyl isomerase
MSSQIVIVASLLGLLASACDAPSSGGGVSPPLTDATPSAAPPAASASAAASSSAAAPSASATHIPVPDTIVAQHILVGYKGAQRIARTVTRNRLDAKARAAEALAKLRGGAEFEDMVKEYSDDPGSVDRLGLLGKFHRADLDPAFSKSAFALQVEQISDVVETPFGFHIIKRTQ